MSLSSCGEAVPAIRRVNAGAQVEFVARKVGAGAALFAWSAVDCYEQLSDAYTFMELRKVNPEVGDVLYSTLRRPFLTVVQDDPVRSIDLLVHDRWHPRDACAEALIASASSSGIVVPRRQDWPYAVNLFARTVVESDGGFRDDPVAISEGSCISVVAQCDIVFAVVPASSDDSLFIDWPAV